MFINPYIEKVVNHKNIISENEIIYKNKWNWSSIFQNKNPINLEIWTGLGNFFSKINNTEKDKNFIWMEIKYKRLFVAARKTLEAWRDDFILLKDYGQNIDKIFAENEINNTYIFFPDPWDKKDYQKKNKLLQKDFLEKLYKITKKWWIFTFKTDHKDYFEEVLEIVKKDALWKIIRFSFDYESELDIFDKQNMTEFEALFRWENKKVCYAEFGK